MIKVSRLGQNLQRALFVKPFRYQFLRDSRDMATTTGAGAGAGGVGKGATTTITITTWPDGKETHVVVASVVDGAVLSTITATAAAGGGASASPTAKAGVSGGSAISPTPSATASRSASGSSATSGAEASASNAPTPPGSSSISSGTVAGAAVGAFVGGLLIGLAIVLLVCRGRKRKQNHGISKEPPILETHNEVVRPKDRDPTDRHLQANSSLLDATSDGELAEAYRNIHKLLQQHMDNFYHRQPVEVDYDTLMRAAERLELVPDDVHELESLMSLVEDPRTRVAALHHIIAQVLVRSIDFNSPGNLSCLPPHLVGLARSFPAAERGGGNSDGKHSI